LLIALLEPPGIKAAEIEGDHTTRLALQEESKSLPFGSVWDYYCDSKSVPLGDAWLSLIKKYEKDVLLAR
jgi:L-rhamnose isomerase